MSLYAKILIESITCTVPVRNQCHYCPCVELLVVTNAVTVYNQSHCCTCAMLLEDATPL